MITLTAPPDTIIETGYTRRPVTSAVVIVLSALVVGILTSFGHEFLPSPLSSVANSAGAWTVITYGAIYLVRSGPLAAALLGAVAFVLMNETYALVSGWRGFPYFDGLGNQWNIVGVLIGPIVGTAAAWVRSPVLARVIWAAAAPAAVLVGEGIYGLTLIASSTSPVYWVAQIIAGGVIVAAITAVKLRDLRLTLITYALTLALAGLVVLVYALVPRILFGF